eukprot:7507505-Ditylum_brightwellii.AAC.1
MDKVLKELEHSYYRPEYCRCEWQPDNMNTRQFVAQVNKINRHLMHFPVNDGRTCPPKLSDDEIMDLLEAAMHPFW